MAKYSIEDTTLTNIADAIREKTKKTDSIPVSSFNNEIASIEADPSEFFETTVTASNYTTFGANFVKKTPIIKIEEGVTRPKYTFSSFPKADLVIDVANGQLANCEYMFHNSNITSVNLFDTSANYSMSYMFYNCKNLTSIPNFNTSTVVKMDYAFYGTPITELPEIDTSICSDYYSMCQSCTKLLSVGNHKLGTNQTSNVSISSMFSGCSSLTEIGNLECSNVVMSYNTFYNCRNLTTIGALTNLGARFGTSQNANSVINLSSCTKLTHDSLMNVINSIADVTSLGWTPPLTLGSTNLAKLTEEEKAIAVNKGWALS